jgi:hypothetical protein
MSNLPCINLCGGAYTTGNAVAPYLSVYCADSWNGLDTIVVLSSNSGANSGVYNGSRIILDSSYATCAGTSGNALIGFQSQGTNASWQTNAKLQVTNGGVSVGFYVYGTVYYYALTSLLSDKKTKKDIVKINKALDKIEQINGVSCTSLIDNSKRIGVIAQDVQKVAPEVISTDDKGQLGVCYSSLVGLLVEGIKELNSQIQDLKNELNF